MPHLESNKVSLAYAGRLRSFSPTLKGAGYISSTLLIATPVFAHKLQIAEDIGGTLHIEPNDTPRAGEASLTWFALTRQGGKVLSLEECNCKLSIYSSTSKPGSLPILTPSLKPVSAERYQGIPGAEIEFPKPGAYQLKLSGTPKVEGSFKPFELKFEVTVAAGTSKVMASSEIINILASKSVNIVPAKQVISWQLPLILVLVILGLGVFWGVIRKRG